MDRLRKLDLRIPALLLLSGTLMLEGATAGVADRGDADSMVLAATRLSGSIPEMKQRVEAQATRLHRELLEDTRAALRAMEQPAAGRRERLMLSEADPSHFE